MKKTTKKTKPINKPQTLSKLGEDNKAINNLRAIKC